MATNYTSTIKGRCWKEHTCVTCGAVFRYVFERVGRATASTPGAAENNARAALSSLLTTDVDHHPCPHCGLIQPDMIGKKRGESHRTYLWITAGLALLLVIAGAAGWDFRTFNFVGAIVGAVIAVGHIAAALRNPNHDLSRNKSVSAGTVSKNVLLLTQPGNDPGLDSVPMNLSGGMKLAILLLLAAVPLYMTAEFARVVGGWRYNATCNPPVCGPGDTVRHYTGDSVSSIKGNWRGSATLKVKNKTELPLSKDTDTFQAFTRTEGWGSSFYVKSSEKNQSSSIYGDIAIPNVAALEGKTAVLDLTLDVIAPQVFGISFNEVRTKHTSVVSLAMSSPNCGARYLNLWWSGIIGGLASQLIAGFILASIASSLRKGLPTQLYALS